MGAERTGFEAASDARRAEAMGKEKNTGGEKKGQKKAARTLKEKRAAKKAKKG